MWNEPDPVTCHPPAEPVPGGVPVGTTLGRDCPGTGD
jgi:hypothetical protein